MSEYEAWLAEPNVDDSRRGYQPRAGSIYDHCGAVWPSRPEMGNMMTEFEQTPCADWPSHTQRQE